jgi:hypothetical protein
MDRKVHAHRVVVLKMTGLEVYDCINGFQIFLSCSTSKRRLDVTV